MGNILGATTPKLGDRASNTESQCIPMENSDEVLAHPHNSSVEHGEIETPSVSPRAVEDNAIGDVSNLARHHDKPMKEAERLSASCSADPALLPVRPIERARGDQESEATIQGQSSRVEEQERSQQSHIQGRHDQNVSTTCLQVVDESEDISTETTELDVSDRGTGAPNTPEQSSEIPRDPVQGARFAIRSGRLSQWSSPPSFAEGIVVTVTNISEETAQREHERFAATWDFALETQETQAGESVSAPRTPSDKVAKSTRVLSRPPTFPRNTSYQESQELGTRVPGSLKRRASEALTEEDLEQFETEGKRERNRAAVIKCRERQRERNEMLEKELAELIWENAKMKESLKYVESLCNVDKRVRKM